MATVSKVFIANLALSLLGTKSTIESLTERSREANEMDLWYEITRKNLMERFDWSFCRTREELALDDEAAPAAEWAYRYIYPSDCLKVRKLQRPGFTDTSLRYGDNRYFDYEDNIPLSVEESPDGAHTTILTNLEDAVLVYTRDLDDPSRYPMAFVILLSKWLAANTAYNITGKGALAEKVARDAEIAYNLAAASDANESIDRPPKDADWIRGRR